MVLAPITAEEEAGLSGCTPRLRQSYLAASVVLSMLLHAFVLIAFREVPADLSVSESKSVLPVEVTLRTYRSRSTWMGDGQAEARRSVKSRTTEEMILKPAASVEPLSAQSEAISPTTQEMTHAGSGNGNSAYTPIDLEAAMRIARETDRTRERSLSELAFLGSTRSEFGTVLGRGIAKAARPDCLTAHAGMGLLAIAFLVKDAITDNGCKW